jgi:hypothetical protein
MTRTVLILAAVALLCGPGCTEEVRLPATPATAQGFPAIETPGPDGWTLTGLRVEAAFACNPREHSSALPKAHGRPLSVLMMASLVANLLPPASTPLTGRGSSPTHVALRTNDLTALTWFRVAERPAGPGLRR